MLPLAAAAALGLTIAPAAPPPVAPSPRGPTAAASDADGSPVLTIVTASSLALAIFVLSVVMAFVIARRSPRPPPQTARADGFTTLAVPRGPSPQPAMVVAPTVAQQQQQQQPLSAQLARPAARLLTMTAARRHGGLPNG